MEGSSARPPVIGVYEGKEFAPGRGGDDAGGAQQKV